MDRRGSPRREGTGRRRARSLYMVLQDHTESHTPPLALSISLALRLSLTSAARGTQGARGEENA